MTEQTPDISPESARELVQQGAAARWGQDFVDRNRETLEQAAAYVVNIANNLPSTETEPGFFQ